MTAEETIFSESSKCQMTSHYSSDFDVTTVDELEWISKVKASWTLLPGCPL